MGTAPGASIRGIAGADQGRLGARQAHEQVVACRLGAAARCEASGRVVVEDIGRICPGLRDVPESSLDHELHAAGVWLE